MIVQRLFSKVSRRKKVVIRDTKNPHNGVRIENQSSHDSGPGWSESSSSESYSSSWSSN